MNRLSCSILPCSLLFMASLAMCSPYYHPDHLGSASWITEGEEPVQYIHYMPYGELWRNQRNTTYDERYKFTGKERDAETGYDFFGARSYSSAITSWLSVDPLSDKYPSISPYAYCNRNPVRYIDPDGCDTFNICRQNREITCIPDPGNSIIRYVDSKGNVSKGIGGDLLEISFEENTISLMDGISGFIVKGDEAGTKLFEFLAESGAMIEWTQLMSGEVGIGLNYISTSWERKSNSSTFHVINKYLRDNKILREHIHNHPVDAIGVPSGMHDRVNKTTGLLEKAGTWGDIGVRNNILKKYSDVVFKIYTSIGEYIDYTNQ